MTPIHIQKILNKHPHGLGSKCNECELVSYIYELHDESASLRQRMEKLIEAGNGLDAATSMSDLCQDEIQAARDARDAAGRRETEGLVKP